MRSKDPEPRNKDIVPQLTDFYIPKNIDEYFVIINPLPLNPNNMNTLKTFLVRSKIYLWKSCRDNW